MQTKLSSIIQSLDIIAPLRFAEHWDNVGLLIGDPNATITRALLAIDYTRDVAYEARALGCELVIAYHPPIFTPLKRLVAHSLAYDAIRDGVAIYSPHTALDVANGGTNDVLADVLGLYDVIPLRRAKNLVSGIDDDVKLVVFVPEKDVDVVCGAMFAAGAGVIGKYSSCSFRSRGTGTFFGEDGARPAVGEIGRLESVDEVRVEMVVPTARIEPVIDALKRTHPYEEPAYDVVRVAPRHQRSSTNEMNRGMGRIGTLPTIARTDLIARAKERLGATHLLVAGPTSGTVSRAAVGAGACGDLVDDVIAQNSDFYLTGEMRHHDALKAAAAGITVVCALHSVSERVALPGLRARILEHHPELDTVLSLRDRDPFMVF